MKRIIKLDITTPCEQPKRTYTCIFMVDVINKRAFTFYMS